LYLKTAFGRFDSNTILYIAGFVNPVVEIQLLISFGRVEFIFWSL